LEEGVKRSAGKITRGGKKSVVEVEEVGWEDEDEEISYSREGDPIQEVVVASNLGDPILQLVGDTEAPHSDEIWLLNDEALEDVNSYVEAKKHPEAVAAEASVILEI
jgi:hypothetical protein